MESSDHQVVVEGDRVVVTFDRSLYPLDAIYGASYVFVDRCFVLLDVAEGDRVQVKLRGRAPLDAEALKALAGEFANELLTETWRGQVAAQNRPIIEAVTARAMAGALGPSELGDMEEAFEADAFDDPLGIAVPWEEKYGKPAAEAAGDPAGAPAAKPEDEPEGGSGA
jgi:His-Xaa-Ser system protein HxsD